MKLPVYCSRYWLKPTEYYPTGREFIVEQLEGHSFVACFCSTAHLGECLCLEMYYTQGVWVWNKSVHDNFRLSSNSNARTMADQWQAETSTCPVDLLQQFAHGLCHRRGKVCWREHTGIARGTGVPCWCRVRRQLLAVSIQTWPVEHVWNKNIMVTELWCNQWTHLKQKHYSHRVMLQPVEHTDTV